MKKVVIFILILFLTGCTEDNVTLEKDNYLIYKEELLEQKSFTKEEDLLLDLNVYADRINEEEITYGVIIDNPMENMYDVKALVIHDNFTDSIFPSVGIFDNPIDLVIGNDDVRGISLNGYIKTDKDIESIDLEIRVYINYINEIGENKKIYYKTTI